MSGSGALTSENLATVRRLVAAFDVGDLDTVFSLSDPEARFENRTDAPGADGTFIGREGVLSMLGKLYEVFEDYRVEPLEFEAAGDRVGVLYREVGHGRTSGIEVDRQIVLVYTLTDGKVVHTDAFPFEHHDLREALAIGKAQ